MEKKILKCVTFIFIALNITACHKATYLPQSEIAFNTEQGGENLEGTIDKLFYDPCTYRTLREYTSNRAEIYMWNGTIQYKVDLADNTYSYLCSRLECSHNDTDCEMQGDKSGMRCYKDGILYASNNILYYRESDGNATELFVNKATTEYANEFSEKPLAINGIIFIDEENVLLIGVNYVYTFNLNTYKAGEIIEVSDKSINTCTYLDGSLYSSVTGGALYVTELNSGKSKKLTDEGINVKASGDRIFYCKWNKGICSLYSNNQQFNDEKMIIEDSGPMFYIFDNMIFFDKDNVIYKYDNEEIQSLCDTNKIEYEYSQLPLEYKTDDINIPNAKLSYLYNYYYIQECLIMELNFEVYDDNGFTDIFTAVYMLDVNGDLIELEKN